MNGFPALEKFIPDAGVLNVSILQNRSRDCECLLRIVGGLADAPGISLAFVPRDDVAGTTFKSTDPFRIPSPHVGMRQRFGLLGDSIAGSESFEARDDAFLKLHLDHRASG
jgi:hypothetical protein